MDNSQQSSRFYLHATRAAAGIVIGTAILVLFGWAFGLPGLKSVLRGLVTMKVNTALGFVLAGISLWNSNRDAPSALSRLAAIAVLALGLCTLGEYLAGIDLGIDQLLMHEDTKLPGDIPGRMAVPTAINFSLLGAALLLMNWPNRHFIKLVHVLALPIAIIGGSGLVGYAYSIEELYRIRPVYTAMAIHTTILFLILVFGIVNARPDYPFRRIMTSSSAEVISTRHLLFAAMVLPFATGWLLMNLYRIGYIGEALGLSLFAVTTMVGFGVLVLHNAGLLYRADLLRHRAEDELRHHEAQLEQMIAVRTEELNRANEALEQQARIDFLTGMVNRRYFMELAETEVHRALRYSSPLSVLMIDIDHFKKVNDTHGHHAGDSLLRNLAGIFNHTLREIDIASRMGGEEFAVILPQTDGKKALEAAERLRVSIANAVITLENELQLTCTASFGVATLAAPDDNIDKLLHRADQALYEAKRSGRDRVCESVSAL